MVKRARVQVYSALIQIAIDVLNLAEQISIYFIVKEDSHGELFEERLFFFVLLLIGLFSNLPSASPYLYVQTVGSIVIELGELLAYLMLLQPSVSVFFVAFSSFFIETTLHCVNMLLEYHCEDKPTTEFIFGTNTCGRVKYVIVRSISYSVFDATSIFFLFLNKHSRFHYRFFEILILLTFYFPSIALGPALESIAIYKYQYEHGQVPQVTLLLVWSLICATLYFTMYSIPLAITGIVFGIRELGEVRAAFSYDFVVYVCSLCFFSMALLVFPPFIWWWYGFTVKRFRTMHAHAKRRLHEDSDMNYCL